MKNLIKILSLFILAVSISCEKKPLTINCDECTTKEPVETNLTIKVDTNNSGVSTIINVYEGNLEDNIIYQTFETTTYQISVVVSLNKKYTVTAKYYIPDNYYIAVDSVTPGVSYIKDQCTHPCYYVYDKVVDLRLKYTK